MHLVESLSVRSRRCAPLARRSNALARFARDERGSYLTIVGLLAPLVAGIAGLGSEYGVWVHRHQVLQSAADSAAISAAVGLSNDYADIATQARAVVANYGFVPNDRTFIAVNRPPQAGPYAGDTTAVEVTIQHQVPRLFSSLWTSQPLQIAAASTAMMATGNGCTLALDPTAGGAVTMQGSARVSLNGCSLFSNSNAENAVSVGGSSTLTTDFVGTVGGITGIANITSMNGTAVNQGPIMDPYGSVPLPSFSGCDHKNYVAKNTVTLEPGVYCGGIALNANAVVTLNPGIYIIDGGDVTVNGGAVLRGQGVTLVFTSSTGSNWPTLTFNGDSTVELTAPKWGPMKGIVIYGDRRIPIGTTFKLNGGSGQTIGGAVYIPTGAITYSGGASTSTACTQLIGDTLTFVGNSNLAADCSQFGTKPISTVVARLVQ